VKLAIHQRPPHAAVCAVRTGRAPLAAAVGMDDRAERQHAGPQIQSRQTPSRPRSPWRPQTHHPVSVLHELLISVRTRAFSAMLGGRHPGAWNCLRRGRAWRRGRVLGVRNICARHLRRKVRSCVLIRARLELASRRLVFPWADFLACGEHRSVPATGASKDQARRWTRHALRNHAVPARRSPDRSPAQPCDVSTATGRALGVASRRPCRSYVLPFAAPSLANWPMKLTAATDRCLGAVRARQLRQRVDCRRRRGGQLAARAHSPVPLVAAADRYGR
jgi:hypothetical protein